jgi:(E)-4-hydroxy-3-methylbut-2-enyl-diphosphate synthase
LINNKELLGNSLPLDQIVWIQLTIEDLNSPKSREKIKKLPFAILVLTAVSDYPIAEWREAFYILHQEKINMPVILHRTFDIDLVQSLLLEATKVYSALLLDGFGDGIWVHNDGGVPIDMLKHLSFGILQSCRLRLTQTDYIACPSCGRTLFNIEERLDEIRKKTKHLKHLKIAVMGCVVNGLGEMVDADYGYVGSGIGKVNLYKGKKLMQKNVKEEDASDALLELIKEESDWCDG